MKRTQIRATILGIALAAAANASAFDTNAVKLTASDGFAGNGFGSALGVSSNTAVICDYSQAYIFTRSGNNWGEESKFPLPSLEPLQSAAISGDTLALASFGTDAYVFFRDGTNWLQEAALPNPDPEGGNWFGRNVALDGDTLVVTDPILTLIPNPENPETYRTGVAYVYMRSNGNWSLKQTLTADGPTEGNGYGMSVALQDNLLVLGYPSKDCDFGCGTIQTNCAPCDPEALDGCVCQSVGAAYVFGRLGDSWVKLQKLVEPIRQLNSGFGDAVAIQGGLIVIGASETTVGGVTNAGAAHVFEGDGVVWTHTALLSASDKATGDSFGSALTFRGEEIIVGAGYKDTAGGVDAGAGYVYAKSNGTWTLTANLFATTPASNSQFGATCAADGETVLIGAPTDGADIGAAYAFSSKSCQLPILLLSQWDSRWATNLYDHSTNQTIKIKGCAMTSVCMALRHAGITNLTVNGATVTNTPATLNDFMKATAGCFNGQRVNWAPAVEHASGSTYLWNSREINSLTNLAEATQYLEETICSNGIPVIVGVKLDAAGNPGHYVLVTGKEDDDFVIANPGPTATNRLSHYSHRFETRGHLTPATAPAAPLHRAPFASAPAASPTAVFIGSSANVELLVTDPLGRRTGTQPPATDKLAEIPNSVQFFDALDDDETEQPDDETSHLVYIDEPVSGAFQITVTGTTNGPVSISIIVRNTAGQLLPPVTIETNVTAGATLTFAASVQTAPPVAHDLAVTKLKAPKKVTLQEGTPPKPGKLTVAIQNLGTGPVTIPDLPTLEAFLNLQIVSLGACAAPVATVVTPTTFPVLLPPGKKLNVGYTVAITCANDPLASTKTENHADYEFLVQLNVSALDGASDPLPANNDCPRPSSGADKGCGNKDPVTKQIGADVTTDVFIKQ